VSVYLCVSRSNVKFLLAALLNLVVFFKKKNNNNNKNCVEMCDEQKMYIFS
jgi:hypothetical protein